MSVRVLPRIGFKQNGFQYRFIRRVNALIQLPQVRAKVLFSRNAV
ncbi:Uncharacterised protein [Vibrio cholerae]|nr:Uncharacterised protein [Vibrio cholerae]